MAIGEQEHGYAEDGLVHGNGNHSDQTYDEKPGSDLEVNPSNSVDSTAKDDPFGDETDSEVKYRTMSWWSVMSWSFQSITRLTGHS